MQKAKKKERIQSILLQKIIKSQRNTANRGRKELHKPARKRQNDSGDPYLGITTLNVNGLNSLIKRHRVAE